MLQGPGLQPRARFKMDQLLVQSRRIASGRYGMGGLGRGGDAADSRFAGWKRGVHVLEAKAVMLAQGTLFFVCLRAFTPGESQAGGDFRPVERLAEEVGNRSSTKVTESAHGPP